MLTDLRPHFTVHARIAELPAPDWDALAGDAPFVRHAFLDALEHCGCVGADSGWEASHLAMWRDRTLVGALPAYIKYHSYGEYVFDWAWAEAYRRHGLNYYPKLLSAIPFSPIPGPRLLCADPADRATLASAALALAQRSGCSSWHVLFMPDAEASALQAGGLLRREGVQFHWHNRGYRDFDDFLGALRSDKRKKIRQERRRVADAGVRMRRLPGHRIGATELELLYRCYAATYLARGQRPYLNTAFFSALVQRMPAHVVLMVASRDGRDIACALNLRDGQRLYGRYWGELEHVPCLHFEACYYQGIDYAIEQGLHVYEGGAQGEHKLARGFEPVRTASAHWLAEPAFAEALERHLAQERCGMSAYVDELEERAPLKTDPVS